MSQFGSNLIKLSYLKLQSAIYYEKANLLLQRKFVEFAYEHGNNIEQVVNYMSNWLKNEDEISAKLDQIGVYSLPKKFCESNSQDKAKNYISNNITNSENKVERLFIFADIPIELHIVAVMWVLKYGVKIEQCLLPCCKANRLAINKTTNQIQDGKSLYKPYFKLYQNWWSKAIEEANHIIDNGSNAYILNIDIKNYFHSISFCFDEDFFQILGIENCKLTDIFVEIHKKYTLKFNKQYLGDKSKTSKGYKLPMGLYSSPLLANWYLHEFDSTIENQLMPAYYGRYVDDIMIVFRTVSEPYDSIKSILEQKFKGIINIKENSYYFLEENPELSIQSDKIVLYFFDKNYSIGLLSKFEAEQNSRSSEYRFLSDEEDSRYSDEELSSFDCCFDVDEQAHARFKPQTEDKYKLSCFLAKFINRRKIKGPKYGKNDDEKIKRYFRGKTLIKNYHFWEKLFVLYAISNAKKAFAQLYIDINNEIDKIIIEQIPEWETYKDDGNIKQKLKEYASVAYHKALSITLTNDEKEPELIDKFKKAHFCREQYLEISEKVVDENLPYDNYFYEKVYSTFERIINPDTKFDFNNQLKELIKKESIKSIKVENTSNGASCEYTINTTDLPMHHITIALVNKYIAKDVLKECRRKKDRELSQKEIEQLLFVLDQIEKLEKCNIFVMPELSLPKKLLPIFLKWSAQKQVAFIAGLEYINERGTVYNIDVVCIPVEINDRKDCIPIFRLKNHYAPIERQKILEERTKIPEIDNTIYNLINWNEFRFSLYNCFELSSIKDRSMFMGELDAIFAIAYNKDLSYFNSIAETTARDLHCYVIVNNVSQYGDSQIIAPKETESKFILKVKGGTNAQCPVNVLVGDIDISALRTFQKYNDKSSNYKPLPAGYNINNKRLKHV